MTNHQSPHVPLVSKKAQDSLRDARTDYASQWRGAALARLEHVRDASVAMLRSMLEEATTEEVVELPKVATDVVERYAGYRPYRAEDMQHW